MKIWFDLSNSPHVNMFEAMIRDLKGDHEVIITCRPLANTIELLQLHGLAYDVVGTHYGRKMSRKVFGFPIRVMQLQRFLAHKGIDVAISQSSFHSPVVSRLLGIRCIYMNDNEHALGNIPAFVSASEIMVPEYLSNEKLKKQWANLKKVAHYPGVKEGIYLWELESRLAQEKRPPKSRPRPIVYVRPEPWTAQYYRGRANFLDNLLLGMKDYVDVTVLPRDRAQGAHYEQGLFSGIRVVTEALDIADITPDCDLFIGAGGTMTREMAVLGIPTISVYQDQLLDVDRYLLAQKAFVHRPSLTAVEALDYLNQATRHPPNRELLDKGRRAYDMIKSAILSG